MKKSMLKLANAKVLDKTAQKSISGGKEIPGGCRIDYPWHPIKRCCWSYIYNCCYGTPACPAPY